jgi:hypothetical protein
LLLLLFDDEVEDDEIEESDAPLMHVVVPFGRVKCI